MPQKKSTATSKRFGVFTVGDVTVDPTTGRAPSEHDRIKAMLAIALEAEEVGLDVFAIGEHHNPPFVRPADGFEACRSNNGWPHWANPPAVLRSIEPQGSDAPNGSPNHGRRRR